MMMESGLSCVRYFKALADETRLRLLSLLDFQELNVQELMEILAMGQSRISRHLKLLQEAGLLSSRRDGLWAFYGTVEQGPGRRFIDSIRFLLEREALFRADLEQAKEVLRAGKMRDRRFFDSIASGWETMKRGIIGELDLAARIVERLPAGGSVADLGCGSGSLLERLAGKAELLIGVDSSHKMLAEAGERLRRLPGQAGGRLSLRIGELEHLPLRDGEVDSAVINLVLHHLRSPLKGLQEALRVLRDGGTLLVADFCRHGEELLRSRYGDRWLGFARQEIESWLAQAGFSVQQRSEFPVQMNLRLFIYRCASEQAKAQPGRAGGSAGLSREGPQRRQARP